MFTSGKWKLSFKVIPLVGLVILLKLLAHQLNLEFLEINALFGAIISANIFLIGFLISGVLVDYKESEKIPGEIACSLEVLADEGYITAKNKKSNVTKDYLTYVHSLTRDILLWFHEKENTSNILDKIKGLNDYYLAFEPLTQANFIVRLKNEQNNIRRYITRVHTIKVTSFNPAAYAIAEIISAILCIGLIFMKFDPYYESIFFVAFVSFILIYMVRLIKDLDDPFEYNEHEDFSDEVSLQPLIDLEKRMRKK